MTRYEENKERVRQEAIDYSNSFAEGREYYWSEIAEIGAYFEKQGKRYGLLEEFRENGII